jgi:putative oxidoreductase
MIETVQRFHRLLISAASSMQSPFLLAVRLYWGWQFVQTGWGKLNNLEKVTQFFTQLGIPAPDLNAHFISTLELVGGILLAVGLTSHLIALLLACNMTVAFVTADRQALFSIFSDADKLYAATPYTFLFASLLILFFGLGKLGLDALLVRRFQSRLGPSPATAAVQCP